MFLLHGQIAFSGHYGERVAEPSILRLHLQEARMERRKLFMTWLTAAGAPPQPASLTSSFISLWRAFPSLVLRHGLHGESTLAGVNACDRGLATHPPQPTTAREIGSELGM